MDDQLELELNASIGLDRIGGAGKP